MSTSPLDAGAKNENLDREEHLDTTRPAAVSVPVAALNLLPTSGELGESIAGLRQMILGLLPELSHVVIVADVSRDPLGGSATAAGVEIVEEAGAGRSAMVVRADERLSVRVDRFIDTLRRNGHPVGEFQPPACYDLALQGQSIGMLLLWKRRGTPQLSSSTLQNAEVLLPFLAHEIAGAIALHRSAHPTEEPFIHALDDMVRQTGMTLSEWRVVTLRLLGQSYKQIAGDAGLTTGTVKKQIARAHEKAGVKSLGELVARFFTPRVSARGDDGPE